MCARCNEITFPYGSLQKALQESLFITFPMICLYLHVYSERFQGTVTVVEMKLTPVKQTHYSLDPHPRGWRAAVHSPYRRCHWRPHGRRWTPLLYLPGTRVGNLKQSEQSCQGVERDEKSTERLSFCKQQNKLTAIFPDPPLNRHPGLCVTSPRSVIWQSHHLQT